MRVHTLLASIVLAAAAGLGGACDSSPTDDVPAAEAPAPIEARVRALTGVVEPFARVVVAAETGARIRERHVERGDRVEADALLYSLDGSRAQIEYQRAQASVAARGEDLAQAERERERSATLHAREGISAAAHERTSHVAESAAAAEELARISKRAASRSLRDARIRAPFAGIVAEFHVEVGDFVGPGTPTVTLVDLSRVRLRVGLTPTQLELVEVGARVPVRFADLGGLELEAELRSVSPLVDPRTGTYAAELWLDNPGERLRQGMLGRVELDLASAPGSITIPRSAVVRRGRDTIVWVVDEAEDPARVHARPLILGRADTERVAVLDGLSARDAVVIEGMFALREGAAVAVEDHGGQD